MNTESSSQHWCDETSFLEELFLFAVLMDGDLEAAHRRVLSAFRKLERKPEMHEKTRGARLLFAMIYRSAPPALSAKTAELPPSLESLKSFSKIERGAAALFLATSLETQDMARVLGVKEAECKRVLDGVRGKLALPTGAPGELPAREDLRSLLPGAEEFEPIRKAARHASEISHHKPLSLMDPGILAAGFAMLLVIVLGVWVLLVEADSFPGEEEVRTILSEAVGADVAEYEGVQNSLGELGDWFVLNGVESFFTPPGFATQSVVGARVFKRDSTPVAVALLPDLEMVIIVFEGTAGGVRVEPEGEWKFFQAGPNAGAILQKGGVCFLAAVHGDKGDLRELLARIPERG